MASIPLAPITSNSSIGECADELATGCYRKGYYIPTKAEITAYRTSHPDAYAVCVKYGYYTLYFFAVCIFICILMNLHFKWMQYHKYASY
jgi:hypothetical protein